MLRDMLYFRNYQQLPGQARTILFVFFLYALSWPAITFLPLYLHTSLHYSLLKTGSSVGVYGVGFVIASFLGSALCDHLPAYYVASFGNLCFLLFLVLLLCIKGPYLMVLTFLVLLGMSNAIFSPSARILLMRAVQASEQMHVNSLRYMLFNLGTALAFGVVSLVIHGNYRFIFAISAVCSGLITIILFFLCQKDIRQEILSTPAAPGNRRLPLSYLLILTCFFLGMLVFSQTNSTYSLFLTQTALLSTRQLGLLFLLNSLLIVLFQIKLTQGTRALQPTTIMNTGVILMGLGFLMLAFNHAYDWVICSMIIITVGEMLFMPTSQTLAYQAAPESNRGYYMGIYQAVYASAFIFVPLLGSWALDSNPNGHLLWSACMMLSLTPLILSIIKLRLSKVTIKSL